MPAIAIADIIRERCEDAEILFVGVKGGMEERLVTRAGYEIKTIRVMGFARKLTPRNVKAAYLAIRSVGEAAKLLSSFAPDLVIGTGGYASYPALKAAVLKKVPCAVHESNAVPGLAVRKLAPFVDRVWLNFEGASVYLSPKASVCTVGNPLPQNFTAPKPIAMPKGARRMVLSFGGSLGASALNGAILSLMEAEREDPTVYHLHATGEKEYDSFCREMAKRGLDRCQNLRAEAFLSPMCDYMATAHVVICRAGAMSISELAALGCPAILVPSPNVTGNHQYKNAQALEKRGAAILVSEGEAFEKRLQDTAFSLLYDDKKRASLSRSIKGFYQRNAREKIFAEICQLLKKKGEKRR